MLKLEENMNIQTKFYQINILHNIPFAVGNKTAPLFPELKMV